MILKANIHTKYISVEQVLQRKRGFRFIDRSPSFLNSRAGTAGDGNESSISAKQLTNEEAATAKKRRALVKASTLQVFLKLIGGFTSFRSKVQRNSFI